MWRAAAKKNDETLSEWIRKRLNLAAARPPATTPSVPPAVSGDQLSLLKDERRGASIIHRHRKKGTP